MQEQERFERYTPQFPLPADISTMSRQDTVCQFCGVSYLIHNEIKALEAKCQKLEADLSYYAGISSREAALEQSLESERTKVSDLQSTIAISNHKINEMSRKMQLIQDQFENSDRSHRETNHILTQCRSHLRTTYQHIQTIRSEYAVLRSQHEKEKIKWKSDLENFQQELDKELRTAIEKYNKRMKQRQVDIEQYQQQISETNRSIRELQQQYQQLQIDSKESQSTKQNELEILREQSKLQQSELKKLREEISRLEQSRTEIQVDFDQTKVNYQTLERQLADRDQSRKDLDHRLDQIRNELSNERDARSTANLEVEQLRTKLDEMKSEYEQLIEINKQLELNESNSKRKMDDVNRSRQAVLDRTRDEYEKLLRKYTDLDELYRELLDKRDQETLESKQIRDELERLHNENIELKKQKETMHIAQNVQIKKLHDQYAKQLHDAEQWPDRLQSELNREREQHQSQMTDLERRLKENFLTELNIEKQKYNGLLRKFEHDNGHSTEQLRHELVSTEKVTIEQRQYYTRQIDHLEKEKAELKNELNNLRDVLKDLHEQLNHQSSNPQDRMNNLQLKEDLLAKETSLFQAQSKINELTKELEQAKDEMSTLQETVHHECAEREQLKDALIDARQQLLSLKKNGVLNGAVVSRSLHSPPVAFEDIERRVAGTLPYPQAYNQNRGKVHSEPPTRDSSLPGDAADLMARPMSSNQNPTYRLKTLPPIQTNNQQSRTRGLPPPSNKAEQLLANQRRIARFIKHIK